MVGELEERIVHPGPSYHLDLGSLVFFEAAVDEVA